MKTLRLILGDQLSKTISSLEDCNFTSDIILMCEVWEEATYVKHHKMKIAFLFSAMRHFAIELEHDGYNVEYVKLSDSKNSGSFTNEVLRHVKQHNIERIVVTHPGEYRVLQDIQHWEKLIGVPVIIKSDNRFLCDIDEFTEWASGRKQLRMEYFYRNMRLKYSILMEDSEPIGGKWNYDTSNRKVPNRDLTVSEPLFFEKDPITQEVLEYVSNRFADHFGDLNQFSFAVTRKQALQALNHFIENRLESFGDYQDAMLEDEPWMFHSCLSFYINCGLLLPLECIRLAENAYFQKKAPLNAVEGFIRQIIGWREYVRGIYWMKMPAYAEQNYFNANRDLPSFYWSGDTKMNCIRQCVLQTREYSYAHHIQRLMVLGNFALLSGVNPQHVNEWFMIVYSDAYEWVELPNVTGMILFADGGLLASKPYAAGGNYINKMSNYCKSCTYKVTKKNGEDACPFNYLYWDFLARNRDKLASNHRLAMIYKTFDRMSEEKKQMIAKDSQEFLGGLG